MLRSILIAVSAAVVAAIVVFLMLPQGPPVPPERVQQQVTEQLQSQLAQPTRILNVERTVSEVDVTSAEYQNGYREVKVHYRLLWEPKIEQTSFVVLHRGDGNVFRGTIKTAEYTVELNVS